jgi:hypothetical protein
MQLESAAGRNEDRHMDQTTYDNMSPDEEPDAQALLHVENALEMLEKAAKALRANPPRWNEARGLTEDAAAELSNIN